MTTQDLTQTPDQRKAEINAAIDRLETAVVDWTWARTIGNGMRVAHARAALIAIIEKEAR